MNTVKNLFPNYNNHGKLKEAEEKKQLHQFLFNVRCIIRCHVHYNVSEYLFFRPHLFQSDALLHVVLGHIGNGSHHALVYDGNV